MNTTTSPQSNSVEAAVVANTSAIEVEVQLVNALIRRDAAAWSEFRIRYDRLIHRCITRVTSRFPSYVSLDDVRDIHATLLLQLLANDMHKLRSFNPERGNRLGSWIGLLAVNAAYDHLRSIRRDTKNTHLPEEVLVCENTPDPLTLCVQQEQAQRVSTLLEDFSQRDRQFMDLYFREGLTPEEIAVRMDISVKTVYSKKHKIQSRLEALVETAQMAA
ncbi:MAG: sigma-70 family RNA polymerase sigma factor [Polyangiaceae bacterium]